MIAICLPNFAIFLAAARVALGETVSLQPSQEEVQDSAQASHQTIMDMQYSGCRDGEVLCSVQTSQEAAHEEGCSK